MDESRRGDIPFIKGRRVGPDAIVSRDEQWAAQGREANPVAKEWVFSSFPFHASDAVTSGGATLGTTLNLCIMPSLSGHLIATHVRTTVYTGVSDKELRVCLYRYYPERGSTKIKRRLVKVLNSEAIIDCSTTLRTAPTGVDAGVKGGVVVEPGEPYFLGYRASSGSIRVPTAASNNVGQFPMYHQPHADNTLLPAELNLATMSKTYDGNIPWVSYLSKEASILF